MAMDGCAFLLSEARVDALAERACDLGAAPDSIRPMTWARLDEFGRAAWREAVVVCAPVFAARGFGKDAIEAAALALYAAPSSATRADRWRRPRPLAAFRGSGGVDVASLRNDAGLVARAMGGGRMGRLTHPQDSLHDLSDRLVLADAREGFRRARDVATGGDVGAALSAWAREWGEALLDAVEEAQEGAFCASCGADLDGDAEEGEGEDE